MKILAPLFLFLGVLAGAISSHALRGHLSVEDLAIFDRGILYLLIHGVALLALAPRRDVPIWGVRLIALGTVMFVGGVMSRALLGAGGLSTIAPWGGSLLILGWGWLSISAALKGRRAPVSG